MDFIEIFKLPKKIDTFTHVGVLSKQDEAGGAVMHGVYGKLVSGKFVPSELGTRWSDTLRGDRWDDFQEVSRGPEGRPAESSDQDYRLADIRGWYEKEPAAQVRIAEKVEARRVKLEEDRLAAEPLARADIHPEKLEPAS